MAVTVTYLYPVAGAVPTQAQMLNFNMVVASVASSAAGDNSAAITHDFNLPTSDISSGFPRVVLNKQGADTTAGADWYIASQNPNYTILGAGTVAVKQTTLFTIDRPFSMDR
jgi:hypothetical protein